MSVSIFNRIDTALTLLRDVERELDDKEQKSMLGRIIFDLDKTHKAMRAFSDKNQHAGAYLFRRTYTPPFLEMQKPSAPAHVAAASNNALVTGAPARKTPKPAPGKNRGNKRRL